MRKAGDLGLGKGIFRLDTEKVIHKKEMNKLEFIKI